MTDHPLGDALASRYRIEREIGRGGFATVLLAHDLRHERPVALKVLHPEVAATLGSERFRQEIRFAARLQHPVEGGKGCRRGKGCAGTENERYANRETALMFPIILLERVERRLFRNALR